VLHALEPEAGNVHGAFSRELQPVLTIEPGDSVALAIPDGMWTLDSGEQLEPRDPAVETGHALMGPIELRGARAGQILVVRVDSVLAGRTGVTMTEPPHLIRWELDGDVGRGGGRSVRLAPFLGVMGMPPPEPGFHSTHPPRPWGGNIDCKELVAGTTLHLPIPVDGALFSCGDGHAAQGDGEVSGTAIECAVSAELTLDVRDDIELEWPFARTADAWLTFGFDEHLGRAARIAVDGMLDLMERELGMTREDALAFASVVVDLRVTQVVNVVLGVHAVLQDDAIL
jgi:acetamidase/formamidase